MGNTYLVGKIGKSVKFNPNTWGAIGGDNESPILFKKMAELNPNDTFIIIGRNDVDKHRKELNIPSNLVDVYCGATKEQRKDFNYIVERLSDVKIDGCFLMSGPTANCNIPDKSWKRNDLKNGKKVYAKSLETFQNYVAPVYQYLNESNIPWVLIANDPRYITQGNDLMNQPTLILSQYTETVKMQTFDNWEDQNYIKKDIKSIYAGMEKICLIDKVLPSAEEMQKTKKFMIVLNEGNNGVKSRYPMLKEYVLDAVDDVQIYGKWEESTIGDDKRFKGPKKFEQLQKELPHVKYTFIIPIKPGWVTSKWVEMISNGVLPFYHPTYDEQNNTCVPTFMRVSSAKDLHDKIEFLENNPDEYYKLLNSCMSLITTKDLDGTNISKVILDRTPSINKDGKQFLNTTTNKETQQNAKLDDW